MSNLSSQPGGYPCPLNQSVWLYLHSSRSASSLGVSQWDRCSSYCIAHPTRGFQEALVQTQLRYFERLASQHASERSVKMKRCGCWGYHQSLFYIVDYFIFHTLLYIYQFSSERFLLGFFQSPRRGSAAHLPTLLFRLRYIRFFYSLDTETYWDTFKLLPSKQCPWQSCGGLLLTGLPDYILIHSSFSFELSTFLCHSPLPVLLRCYYVIGHHDICHPDGH